MPQSVVPFGENFADVNGLTVSVSPALISSSLHSFFFYKKLFEKKLSPVSFGLRLSKKFLKKISFLNKFEP